MRKNANRRLPERTGIENPKDIRQQERVKGAPVSIHVTLPADFAGRLRNFYVGDAVRIDVMTVRPHLDKTKNDRRPPEKDSRRPAGEFSAHSSKISRITGAVILELLSVNQKGASRPGRDAPSSKSLVCARLYAMCRSSALVICSFGTAPTICSTTCPFLNSSNVGIP